MKADASGEDRARAIIRYLRGRAFQFHFQKFAVQEALTKNAKSYEIIKTALKEELGSKKTCRSPLKPQSQRTLRLGVIS